MALLRRIPFYKIQFLFYTGIPNDADTAPNGSLAFNTSSSTAPVYVRKSTGWVESTTGSTGVSSVFGRTGAITATTGDYTFAKISGVATIAQLATGTPDGTKFVRDDGTLAVPPGTGGGGGAPTTSDYLVKTADAGLSAERVVTDSTSLVWDWSTGGQAKAMVQFGTSSTTATVGNDARLSDTRTPTSHVLATNTALGGQHTISGVAAGQVLRASSATAANFQALVAGDLPSLPESQITNLVTDLAGKAPTVHTHVESDVTNLVTDLAAKETARLQARMTADQTAIGTTATNLTGLSLSLAAGTHYRFHAVVMYLCAATTATLASRVAYSGTLGTNASGESLYKVYGSSGVPTVWAAVAKETTQIVSAAIITATGGPGASGSATVPCLLEIEGDIFTGTAGSLTIQIVGSAATSITPQADSHLEAWVMT